MNNKIDWNDLQLILAIASSGSLSGAGRHLGVSHATIYRRLGQIENRLSVRLFDRSRTGYVPSLVCERLVATARQIENQVHNLEREVAGQDLRLSGTVRITTLDSFLVGFLTPIFSEFQVLHPDISLEIVVSNQLFSLSRREADIAIRPTHSPTQSLVGRKLGAIAYAVYGRPDFVPKKGDSFNPHLVNWVGPDETMNYSELEKWMDVQEVASQCRCRVNSVVGMYAFAKAGHGVSVLPCYLGDQSSTLVRLSETIPELSIDLWLMTHADLRKTARNRVLMKFLFESLKRQRPLLTGKLK